jgi:hypothetical protein
VIEQHRRLPGQPFVAIATVASAGAALAASWVVTLVRDGSRLDNRTTLVLLCLLGALILTYHFPIHVDFSSKIYMGSVVLYLMAAMLPPAVAASAIGVGILAGELSVCQSTGNHRVGSIIPTQVGRWCLIGLLGSLVAHQTSDHSAIPLVLAAAAMWSLDVLTGPLLLSPLLGRAPWRVISMMVREGGVIESVQYLIGLLGVLEADNQPWAIALLLPPTALVYVAFKHANRMRAQTRQMLEDMADMVDLRGANTAGHCRRVAELTRWTLATLTKYGPESDVIVSAARVHDIGKIGIADEILQKPDKLTQTDWAFLKTHCELGADLLARYPQFSDVAALVRHHHEAWDGSGYPHRLRSIQIPFGSRVIAVADAYDDMTSDQPYRGSLTPAAAAAALREGRGRQWDPEVVDALLRTVKDDIEQPAVPNLRLLPSIDSQGDTG